MFDFFSSLFAPFFLHRINDEVENLEILLLLIKSLITISFYKLNEVFIITKENIHVKPFWECFIL